MGIGGRGQCKKCVHIYANAKMIPVETVPGIRGGGTKKNGGGSEFK
jgi:hypothetical protein